MKRKIIDLTQPWSHISNYPGDPEFGSNREATVANDGYALTTYMIHSHLGTHVDVPAHMFADGKLITAFPLEYFQGKAYVAPFPITPMNEWIAQHEAAIQQAEILLITTGWSQYYGQSQYYQEYPVLPVALTRWLATQSLHLIGIDAPSFDALTATQFANHEVLLGAEILLIENLCQLDKLPMWCEIQAYPLPIASDGSPVRAVAVVEIEEKGECEHANP
ncbi:MAG: cyclase family protein [Culicoidibacterales bacterium]